MKFSKCLLTIVLALEATNEKVIKNNVFSFKFHCSNSSLCRTLKRELSSAVNSITTIMGIYLLIIKIITFNENFCINYLIII